MKIVINEKEINAIEKISIQIGVETQKLASIIEGMNNGSTITFNDLYTGDLFSKEVRDEINDTCGQFMSITKLEDEITFCIDSDFITEYMDLYGGAIVEVVTGLQGIAKSLYFLYATKIKAFIGKWSKKPEPKKEKVTADRLHNDVTDLYSCERCGCDIDSDTKLCDECLEQTTARCISCGEIINDGLYCDSCIEVETARVEAEEIIEF